MEPKYKIFIRTTDDVVIEAFTWCKSRGSGELRALVEAKEFGYDVKEVWSEDIVN